MPIAGTEKVDADILRGGATFMEDFVRIAQIATMLFI